MSVPLERVTSGEPPRFLLLLPPAPAPPVLNALRAAYGSTISDVLKEVAGHSSETAKASVLEIALACPHLVNVQDKPRSSLYDETQAVVAGIYKLIVAIATQEDVNVEDADGVDVRVILVAWSPAGQPQKPLAMRYGPIVDIDTLAQSARQWQFAFGVESEAGVNMMREFVEAKEKVREVGHVRGGDPMSEKASNQSDALSHTANTPADPTSSRHYEVIVGGTWDHLHIGHKLLITMTVFAVDDRETGGERAAIIGMSGDKLLTKKKHAELVESWTDRQKAVATFFNAIIDFSHPAEYGQRHVSVQDHPGPNGKSINIHYPNNLVLRCVEIQDPYGPTITEQQITAIVISGETRAGGQAVNDKRKELGWKELDVFEVAVLGTDEEEKDSKENSIKESFERKISSTDIRQKLARKAGTGSQN